jgi:hypothetical protein
MEIFPKFDDENLPEKNCGPSEVMQNTSLA